MTWLEFLQVYLAALVVTTLGSVGYLILLLRRKPDARQRSYPDEAWRRAMHDHRG